MPDETRVGHCKADETDTYIGRGPDGRGMLETPVGERGWLGNPYTLEEFDREESIEEFRRTFARALNRRPTFAKAVRDLHGETLGCWCRRVREDEPACHGDVIVEYVEQLQTRAVFRSFARPDWKPVAGNYYIMEGAWLRDRLTGRLGVVSDISDGRLKILWRPNRSEHCSARSLRADLRRGRYTVDDSQHPYDKMEWSGAGGAPADA